MKILALSAKGDAALLEGSGITRLAAQPLISDRPRVATSFGGVAFVGSNAALTSIDAKLQVVAQCKTEAPVHALQRSPSADHVAVGGEGHVAIYERHKSQLRRIHGVALDGDDVAVSAAWFNDTLALFGTSAGRIICLSISGESVHLQSPSSGPVFAAISRPEGGVVVAADPGPKLFSFKAGELTHDGVYPVDAPLLTVVANTNVAYLVGADGRIFELIAQNRARPIALLPMSPRAAVAVASGELFCAMQDGSFARVSGRDVRRIEGGPKAAVVLTELF